MKILIVDDNQELAGLIMWMLEEEGFEVKLAKDGEDGYSAYLLFDPDVVLTDIQMPIKNGLELMRHIRCHNPDIKTIYMSANIDYYGLLLEEEKKQYPIGLLEKPFSRDELMSLISQS